MDNTVTIEITRSDHKLVSVRAIMPTWNRVDSDGMIYAKIPFLGLETYGIDENDLEIAIKEAFTCFCLMCEKHGLGIESELEFLGWTKVESEDLEHSIMEAIPANEAFNDVLSTGDTRALSLEMSSLILAA